MTTGAPPSARLGRSDTWLLEVFLACYTLVWGLGFANPLVDTFGTIPVPYSLISQAMSELTLGLLATALGALTLTVALRGSRQQRAWGCAVVCLFWLLILFAVGRPTGWASGVLPHYGLASATSWFMWVRLRRRSM